MLRKISTLIFVLSAGLLRAQAVSEHFNVDWHWDEAYARASRPWDVALFDPAHYERDARTVYFHVWRPGVAEPAGVEVRNVRLRPAPADMVRWIAPQDKPSRVRADWQYLRGAGGSGLDIHIPVLIYQKGQWYLVTAFDLVYKEEASVARTAAFSMTPGHGPLSRGKIYRIETPETGLYKIDRHFLEKLGLNIDEIDPRNIHLLGWGGQMLPLANNSGLPQELAEVPVFVEGEADGRFDEGDYLLFFGFGRHNWNDESQTYNNLYGDHAYYFLRIDDTPGKRITPYQAPAGEVTDTLHTYLAERFFEVDSFNIARLGRSWYSNNFNFGRARRDFDFDFEDRMEDRPVYYRLKAATDNPLESYLRITVNDTEGEPLKLPALTNSMRNNGVKAVKHEAVDSVYVPGDRLHVTLRYDDRGYASARIFLDYVSVSAFCRLTGRRTGYVFGHPAQARAAGPVMYALSDASGVKAVWDITSPFDIRSVENGAGAATFRFKAPPGARRYAVVGTEGMTPEIPENPVVENTDLHFEVFYANGDFSSPRYVVLAPLAWEAQAMRLVEFHRNRGVEAYFAPLEKVYLEFGNGQADPAAIRNFVRYVYEAGGRRLQYVMLLGDTSWDFKNTMLSPEKNTNVIPSYQSLESFSLVFSFVTDDFFVSMDEEEGNFDRSRALPDLAVGRLPVATAAQAEQAVNKLLHYYDPSTYGIWHNTVTLVADDADGPDRAWELGLLRSTMQIARDIETRHPFINLKKIYLDAYKEIATAGGYRYPDAKRDLLNSFEQGSLIINYIGHGNEYGWTHERIMNVPEIKSLRNYDKLPFISTVTCEFGRFDNPYLESGAELFMNNFHGGAFGVVTTVREISAFAGMRFNRRLNRFLMGIEGPQFSGFRTPARALMLAKSHWTATNNKISFLGDPAMPLHFADPQVEITSVRGVLPDTVRALDLVQVEGRVTDGNGRVLNDYNGQLAVKVMDKAILARTLNNDHVPGQEFTFKKLGPSLFNGLTRIQNGRFSFRFRVPKDIRPQYGHGRISLYARQDQDLRRGVDTTLVIGGINTEAPDDKQPPVIKLYMNDFHFTDGGITNKDPFLLAKLYDENGINTAGGIGHDIVAVLDGRADQTFVLNEYYESEEDSYQKGRIKFKFFDLEPGEHKLQLTAWDTYNNKATAEIRFRVVENERLEITHVLNYPNPFIDYTEFWFTHNRPFEELQVEVRIFDVSGQLVWTHSQTVINEGFTSRDIHWNGLDDFGRKTGKGVYFYQLTVRTADGKKITKWEKLVKL